MDSTKAGPNVKNQSFDIGCNSEIELRKIPVHLPSITGERTFIESSLITLCNNIYTSSIIETNSSNSNINKAIFTIHFPTSQILVVNSVACQLINYNSDELCSMKFENLIHESSKPKWSSLKKQFLEDFDTDSGCYEKLLQLVPKNDDIVVVSLHLRKLGSPEKCLVIAEPLDQREASISTSLQGKILSCDEEVAALFQYDSSELVGMNIHTLLPALNFKNNSFKQYTTGRTKYEDAFPVCLNVNCSGANSEILRILIRTFINLNGLLVLNKKLILKNCNHYFIKLFFGRSRQEVINEPITTLIPTFCKDTGYEIARKYECKNELAVNYKKYNSLNKDYDRFSYFLDLPDGNSQRLNYMDDKKSSNALLNFKNISNLEEFDDITFNKEADNTFTTLFTKSTKGTNGFLKRTDSAESLGKKSMSSFQDSPCHNVDSANENEEEEEEKNSLLQNLSMKETKYFAVGNHGDGTYIDLKYEVKKVAISEEVYFCVWVSANYPKFDENNRIDKTSSFDSLSFDVDSFFDKNGSSSDMWTSPGSASLISQSDEILTAGDYCQEYTNVMEIGKGAFGYVKMAFRKSDGLLVVTKFIKKQKVNIRSWVYHSSLNMKIPLEINFLITLQHPNIVKVLDVFHNDFFVQLVMEKHGAGFDLFEFIDRGPNCDEKLKSYIFRQIVSAVHYLNSLGIIHRDIKDENVIINEKFEVKLIDFGSAAYLPPDESFSKFYGTVEYCSPEVLQGNRYRGPELEIWALGVTLYILSFGENPFYDVEDTVRGLFSIPTPISEELNHLLHQMLDKNIETRITIDKLTQNPWINQPVNIENYKFEEVVRCYESEAHPPKYVFELQSDRSFANKNSDHKGGDSLESITDGLDRLDNLSSNAQRLTKVSSESKIRNSVLFTSTPVKKRNFRPCKSAIGLRRRLENSLPVNDFIKETLPIWFDNLNLCKLKHFNSSSPNLTKPQSLEKEVKTVWNDKAKITKDLQESTELTGKGNISNKDFSKEDIFESATCFLIDESIDKSNSALL